MRTLLIPDEAVSGLCRHGTGRWAMPLAALVAVVMSVGVSAVLAVNRIDNGTTAASVVRLTVASAQAATSVTTSFAAAGH